MPGNAVSVNVEFQALPFNISTVTPSKGSFTITIPPSIAVVTSARTDETVRISAAPNAGYHVDSVTVFRTGVLPEQIVNHTGADPYEFTVPAFDVSVRVLFAPDTFNS